MKLEEIIPVAEVEAHFPRGLKTVLLNFADFPRIVAEAPMDVHGSCMNVWNWVV